MPSANHSKSLRRLLIASSILSISPIGLADEKIETIEKKREETVTIYGTSNPIPVFDYPGQVTVLDRKAIEEIAPSSMSDVLRDVPGVDFSGGPRRTGELPSIRGLSGQNVLILLDGARQSFNSAHDGRFFVDPELIGSAEILKGPASSLYGSGAVGGVLAFESVNADDLLADDEVWGARMRVGYQSVNEETLASLSTYTKQGNFDGLASLGIRQSSDIELGSGVSLPSDDEITTALLKGSFSISDALSIGGSWQRFGNSAIEPNNGQSVAGTGDSILDQSVEKDITTDTFRLGLNFNPAQNDAINLGFTAYQTTSEVDEFDSTIPRTTIREIETTGINIRNASQFNLGTLENTLTIGADWYKDEQIGIDDQTSDLARGGVPNGMSEFSGAFAQLETIIDSPAGEFLLIPGVRYDSFESSSSLAPDSENSDNAVSPRIAASLEPKGTEWLRVFASYSEGFRAPSINELYLDGVHFSLPHPVLFDPSRFSFVFVSNNFIPNPNLVPEETETVEFGAGVDFTDIFSSKDRLQAKVSYYETDAENLINLSVNAAPDPTCFAPPTFQPCTFGTSESSNVDSAELNGIEGELQYDSERILARTTYSSIEGTNKNDGSDLGSLTPDRLALNLALKMHEWNAVFGTRVQIASDFQQRLSDGIGGFTINDERDGYSVVDLYASWKPSFIKGLRFDAGIDNLFEENYERVFAGVSQPTRNFKLTAAWQFGQ